MRTHRKTLIVLAAVAGASAATGCGAARQTTSSTTAITPEPTLETKPSATPSASPTPTASPSPEATKAPAKGGAKLVVDADPSGQLKFTQSALTAKAGNTTIDFTNKAPVPHNVAIRKDGGKPIVETPTVTGKSVTADVKLAAGTYEYYCTVPGHEQAGMKGTLTVR